MRQFLIAWLAVVTFGIRAQPTFENVIVDVPGENIPASVIQTDNGYMICAQGFEPQNNGWASIKLFFTDESGNVVDFKFLGQPNFGYSGGGIGSFKRASDNNFILGSNIANPGNTRRWPLLVKFDVNGDTLWTKKFGSANGYDSAEQVCETPDGGFALFGRTTKFDQDGDYYLIKTDNAGNFEWEKAYGGSGRELGNSIEVFNNQFLISGASQSFSSGQKAYYLKVDSMGTPIFEKTYGTQGFDAAAQLTLLKSGEFLLWGGLDTVVNNTEWQWAEFIAKFDIDGNLIWRTFVSKRERCNIWQVRELQDGSIVFIGEAVYQGINEDAGWIGKLDADGNVLWERFHIYKERPFFWREAKFRGDFQQTNDGA